MKRLFYIAISFIAAAILVNQLYKLNSKVQEFEDSVSTQEYQYASYTYTDVEEEESTLVLYDLPLADEVQSEIISECNNVGVDPEIIFSMIGVESGFHADAIGDGGDSFGLMQIQPKWQAGRMEKLNVTNLFDPVQNSKVGIDLMAELLSYNKGTEWALTAYNAGISNANKIGCNSYAEKVMNYSLRPEPVK